MHAAPHRGENHRRGKNSERASRLPGMQQQRAKAGNRSERHIRWRRRRRRAKVGGWVSLFFFSFFAFFLFFHKPNAKDCPYLLFLVSCLPNSLLPFFVFVSVPNPIQTPLTTTTTITIITTTNRVLTLPATSRCPSRFQNTPTRP